MSMKTVGEKGATRKTRAFVGSSARLPVRPVDADAATAKGEARVVLKRVSVITAA